MDWYGGFPRDSELHSQGDVSVCLEVIRRAMPPFAELLYEVPPWWILHWLVVCCSSPSEVGFMGGNSRITVPPRDRVWGRLTD